MRKLGNQCSSDPSERLVEMEAQQRFHKDLEFVINRHGIDSELGVPDWQVTKFLVSCLETLATATEGCNAKAGREAGEIGGGV